MDTNKTVIHFHSASTLTPTTPLEDTPVFQLLDDSYGYLPSYRVGLDAMREVILRAARQSESIRGPYDPALIHDLFGTPMEPALAYDVVLRYVNERREEEE